MNSKVNNARTEATKCEQYTCNESCNVVEKSVFGGDTHEFCDATLFLLNHWQQDCGMQKQCAHQLKPDEQKRCRHIIDLFKWERICHKNCRSDRQANIYHCTYPMESHSFPVFP